jgi:hypothetical protein
MNVRHRPAGKAFQSSQANASAAPGLRREGGIFREAKPHRVANMSALATTKAQRLNFEDVNII